MPRFYDQQTKSGDDKDASVKKDVKMPVKYPNLILVLAFFFFSISCGIEAFSQSQSFTFGLCGPHRLSPQKVASHCHSYQPRTAVC